MLGSPACKQFVKLLPSLHGTTLSGRILPQLPQDPMVGDTQELARSLVGMDLDRAWAFIGATRVKARASLDRITKPNFLLVSYHEDDESKIIYPQWRSIIKA